MKVEGGSVSDNVTVMTMGMDDLEAENSFEEPMKISPKEGSASMEGDTLKAEIPSTTFSIYKISL